MMGAALTLMAPAYATPLISGVEPPRSTATAFSGNPLSGTFAASDGYLAIVCNASNQGEALVQALAASGASAEEVQTLVRFADAGDIEGSQRILAAVLARRSVAAWVAVLEAVGVPIAAVASPIEAARSVSADWPIVTIDVAGGQRQTKVPGIGYQSTEALTTSLKPPARRGQHTSEVLAEAGLDHTTIEAMLAEGVAFSPERLARP